MRYTLLAACAAVPVTAIAQEARPERPYRGLFASRDKPAPHQTLDISWSLSSAVDDSLTAGSPVPGEPTNVLPWYGIAEGGVSYSRQGERVRLGVFGTAARRQFLRPDTVHAFEGSARTRLQADVGRHTRVRGGVGFYRRPVYQIELLEALVPSFTPLTGTVETSSSDATTVSARLVNDYAGSAGLTRQLGRQAGLDVDLWTRHSHFGSAERFARHSANFGFRRDISRHAALRLGYVRDAGATVLEGARHPVTGDTLEGTMDLRRTLSPSRRLSLKMMTGLARWEFDNGDMALMTGEIAFDTDLGRTWHTGMGVRRHATFVPGISDPLVAHSGEWRLKGLFARRVESSTAAGYSSGYVQSSSGNKHYAAYSGSVGMRVAFTSRLSMDVSYTFVRYEFDAEVLLPQGVPNVVRRHMVRCGLAGWLPLAR